MAILLRQRTLTLISSNHNRVVRRVRNLKRLPKLQRVEMSLLSMVIPYDPMVLPPDPILLRLLDRHRDPSYTMATWMITKCHPQNHQNPQIVHLPTTSRWRRITMESPKCHLIRLIYSKKR